MALIGLIRGNVIKCQKNILKILLNDNFALTFVDHHLLPDINFNKKNTVQ